VARSRSAKRIAKPDRILTNCDHRTKETANFFIHAKHINLISVNACKSLVRQFFHVGRYERKSDVMARQPEFSSAQISRRSVLLQGAACAAGVATILVADANYAKANPLPKTAVNYQNTPKGDHQCSGCSLFVPPNACKNVAGDISPNGWCLLWRKA
jgi:hypothetical protein